MRIDPHILTETRNALVREHVLVEATASIPFFHRATASAQAVQEKIRVLDALHQETNTKPFTLRLGQALEIAVYRALCDMADIDRGFLPFGAFLDLDEHDDATAYKQEPPPATVGRRKINGKLDFVVAWQGDIAAIRVT